MLKYIVSFFFVQLIGGSLHAQYHHASNAGRITVVSDNQPFILSLNGVVYNDRPELQVTIDGLPDQLYTINAMISGRGQQDIERRQIAVSNEEGDFVEMIFKVGRQRGNRGRSHGVNLFAQIPIDMSSVDKVPGVAYAYGAPSRPIDLSANPDVVILPINSITPITKAELDRLFSLMNQESFDDAKFKIINPIFSETTLRVEQISDIMKRFGWDEGKLKVAKAAYANCSDKRNYSTLAGNFTFLGNKNDLLKFIEQQQKLR
ncbi:MAG: DUF4476 domain-containing protein [Sphingobacterium sp.]|jgi:hypothetical protein|nr:DUF4476 domain-containing protein [Sphingobacterium sp.]